METTTENLNSTEGGNRSWWEPSSSGYISAIIPASTAQETTEKRGWKGCKS